MRRRDIEARSGGPDDDEQAWGREMLLGLDDCIVGTQHDVMLRDPVREAWADRGSTAEDLVGKREETAEDPFDPLRVQCRIVGVFRVGAAETVDHI